MAHDESSPSPDDAQTEVAEQTEETSAPGTHEPPVEGTEELTNTGTDRGVVIGAGLHRTALWSVRLLVIAAAAAGLWWLLGKLWVGVLPVILALIVCTVLWPPVAFLRRHRWPDSLSSIVTIAVGLGLVVGVLAVIAPSFVAQSQDLATTASNGVSSLITRLSEPPFNIDRTQLDQAVAQGTQWLRDNSGSIASGVFTGVGVVSNGIVTGALVLVLTFFFLKDGPRFLPWLRRLAGRSAGRHLTEVLTRSWNTLGGFIRTQAIVSLVDAVLIDIGLVILGVPLALPLAVLTFFGGFIPIVGAFTAGALAVLVGLVDGGVSTAVWVLVIVLAVQQLESNVLQPILQSKSMDLHPVVILLAVAGGGTLFGIAGAFLAVPVAAVAAVVARYLSEQADLMAGDLRADDTQVATKEGERAARWAERAAERFRRRRQSTDQ